ncbi:hypothetical protein DW070_00105 [Coprococcus catus]|uniref:Uncharacterized protein n=1 Tax=Coprococcus catus TaxID=116085 RepID=A0A3E2TTD1_9FIRM|nr:hypothetical protein DW070_00105 [Coprococcus catus]
MSTQLRTEIPYEYSVIDYNNGETDTILSRLPSEIKDSSLIADSYECVEGTMQRERYITRSMTFKYQKHWLLIDLEIYQ